MCLNGLNLKAGFGVLMLVALNSAFAQSCPGGTTRVTSGTPADGGTAGGNFSGFISNALICATRGSDRWQEWHGGSSQLWDYKLGASSTMDPSKQVGTWSSANGSSATVTHTYGGTSYVWAICRTNSSAPYDYTMVSLTGGTITGVKISTVTSVSACP